MTHFANRRRSLLLLATLIGPFATVAAGAPTAAVRPFGMQDILGLRRVTAAQISPAGDQLLYVIEELPRSRTGHHTAELWIASIGRPVQPRLLADDLTLIAAEANWLPSWSPDGRRILVPAPRASDLRIYDVETGARNDVAAGADVVSVSWAPDSKRAALVSSDGKVAVANVGGRSPSSLQLGDSRATRAAWSPSGSALALVIDGDLYLMSPEGGALTPLVRRPGPDQDPVWSPDGKWIAFSSSFGEPFGTSSLSVVAATGGPPIDVGRGVDTGFGRYPTRFIGWGPRGESLLFARLNRMTHLLYRLDLLTGHSLPLLAARRADHGFSLSADGKRAALIASDPTHPSRLLVADLELYREREIATNATRIEAVDTGRLTTLGWTSADGTPIEGLLLLPASYRAGKRYPLVVLMEGTYGSFDYSFTSRAAADNDVMTPFQQYLLAGAGYAVLMPNPRGSWGYGPDFARKGLGDFGEGPHADVMAGVDEAIRRGIADPGKLAIMGMWTDGYRAFYSMTRSDRFRAAVVLNGLFNLESAYGGDSRPLLDRMLGGPPWKRRDVYDALSPARSAEKYRTPTLLLVSRGAPCCYEEQGREAAAVLDEAKVDAQLATYDNAEQLFQHGEPWLATLERIQAWLGRYLAAAPRDSSTPPGPAERQ
ncbi:MAG TPA: prolyl oligopeptidase family serine peptidase [Allosphingosinicella sp.]|jgi:dipeptidyl aminopeptidase/acylaminoacyl peptidase